MPFDCNFLSLLPLKEDRFRSLFLNVLLAVDDDEALCAGLLTCHVVPGCCSGSSNGLDAGDNIAAGGDAYGKLRIVSSEHVTISIALHLTEDLHLRLLSSQVG